MVAATQYIEALKGSNHLCINDQRPRNKQVFGGSSIQLTFNISYL
jgi:hypothetical protein